jgi:flagellar biosynthesis/type III secretory pathway protein FliH
MPDDFVPLLIALRPPPPPLADDCAQSRDVVRASESADAVPVDVEEALACARRFRAALADALALSLERLVRDIACDVLARELALAPAEVAAIAARALERYLDECPVRLRVHPDDAAACAHLDVPVVDDERLRPGDVALDVRCGSIDASLGARVEAVLA